MYNRYAGQRRPNHQALRQTDQLDREEKARGDIPRMIGNYYRMALPVVGTIAGAAMGGPVGAQMGGQMGAQAGNVVGQTTDAYADEQMDPARERELRRQALMMALRR